MRAPTNWPSSVPRISTTTAVITAGDVEHQAADGLARGLDAEDGQGGEDHGQVDRPVDEAAHQGDGGEAHAALDQEVLEAGLLGRHVGLHQAQAPDHEPAHQARQRPAQRRAARRRGRAGAGRRRAAPRSRAGRRAVGSAGRSSSPGSVGASASRPSSILASSFRLRGQSARIDVLRAGRPAIGQYCGTRPTDRPYCTSVARRSWLSSWASRSRPARRCAVGRGRRWRRRPASGPSAVRGRAGPERRGRQPAGGLGQPRDPRPARRARLRPRPAAAAAAGRGRRCPEPRLRAGELLRAGERRRSRSASRRGCCGPGVRRGGPSRGAATRASRLGRSYAASRPVSRWAVKLAVGLLWRVDSGRGGDRIVTWSVGLGM